MIEEIKAALEERTTYNITNPNYDPNERLIANAPIWIECLLKKNDELVTAMKTLGKELASVHAELKAEKEAHLETRMTLKGCEYQFKKSQDEISSNHQTLDALQREINAFMGFNPFPVKVEKE